MSAHETCGRPGKFDCEADETISTLANEDGAGDGSVESPSGWFSGLRLVGGPDMDTATADALAEHYGVRYVIAREDGDGRFWVEAYAMPQPWQQRLDDLQEDYERWAGSWL